MATISAFMFSDGDVDTCASLVRTAIRYAIERAARDPCAGWAAPRLLSVPQALLQSVPGPVITFLLGCGTVELRGFDLNHQIGESKLRLGIPDPLRHELLGKSHSVRVVELIGVISFRFQWEFLVQFMHTAKVMAEGRPLVGTKCM
jgi:hypothetical protein